MLEILKDDIEVIWQNQKVRMHSNVSLPKLLLCIKSNQELIKGGLTEWDQGKMKYSRTEL